MPPVTHHELGDPHCMGEVTVMEEHQTIVFRCTECGQYFGRVDSRLFVALNQFAASS